jgi:hypothetical protein
MTSGGSYALRDGGDAPPQFRAYRVLVAALVPLLLASGCIGVERDARVNLEWRRDPSLPCPQLGSGSSDPMSAGPDVERLYDLPLEVGLGPVKLWGPHLSYPVDRRQVVVCDLVKGKVVVVAERRAAKGTVYDYVVGADEYVVYTRLSDLPNVMDKVDWAIEAVNLSTGERQVLAEFREGTPDLVPRPSVRGNWVAWTQEEEGGVAVRVHDLATNTGRELAGPEVQAGNVGIAERNVVVFDGTSGAGRRDVFAVPADGSAPLRRLTDQGKVQPLIVANGRVTWRNGAPGPTEPERWTMVPDRDEEPVRVASRGRAVPGGSFLVTEEGEGLAVHALSPGSPPMPLVAEGQRLDRGALWDVSGDVVVWVGVDYPPLETVRRHLHVARVRLGEPSR